MYEQKKRLTHLCWQGVGYDQREFAWAGIEMGVSVGREDGGRGEVWEGKMGCKRSGKST